MSLTSKIPNIDEAVLAYVKLIQAADAVHTQVSKGLAPHRLTPSQFSTLKVLAMRGSLPQRDIANYLLKTGGNITVVVDNLEREGLVERRRCKEDRRLVYVDLTAKGHDLFHSIYPEHLDRIRAVMEALPAEDQALLRRLLTRLHPIDYSVHREEASTATE